MARNRRRKPAEDSGNTRERRDSRNPRTSAKFDRLNNSNDPNWYALSDQMLIDSASFPYASPLGTTARLGYKVPDFTSHEMIASDLMDQIEPGVMAINYVPIPGISKDNASPINVAAKNIYSFVRHVNSGHANYDSPDLMMYLLAMDSLYAWHAFLRRLYGELSVYVATNRYYPRGLIKAMHCDIVDLVNNLAQLRAHINVLAVKIGSLAVPSTMSYIARHIWMNSNVFVDGLSTKVQSYIFVPYSLWTYSEVYDGTTYTGSKLTATKFPTTDFTLATIQSFSESLLTPLISSEDIGIMSGDILKAFGQNIIQLPITDETYVLVPIYSAEVLSQIENSVAVGYPVANWTISQTVGINEGAIICTPQTATYPMSNAVNRSDHDVMINMHLDRVTPADTMVATRLSTHLHLEWNDTTNTFDTVISSAGSELVTTYSIFSLNTSGVATKMCDITSHMCNEIAQWTQTRDVVKYAVMISKFDWHPLIHIWFKSMDAESPNEEYCGVLGNIENYTMMDYNDLEQMNQSALISEFSIPMAAVKLSHSN